LVFEIKEKLMWWPGAGESGRFQIFGNFELDDQKQPFRKPGNMERNLT